METLSAGMYIRIKDGEIHKIKSINNEYIEYENGFGIPYELKEYIVKASYNIIDLIKSKDIILGKDGKMYQCWKIYKDYIFTYSKNKQGQTITLVDYQINKVITKEQFDSVAYRI